MPKHVNICNNLKKLINKNVKIHKEDAKYFSLLRILFVL